MIPCKIYVWENGKWKKTRSSFDYKFGANEHLPYEVHVNQIVNSLHILNHSLCDSNFTRDMMFQCTGGTRLKLCPLLVRKSKPSNLGPTSHWHSKTCALVYSRNTESFLLIVLILWKIKKEKRKGERGRLLTCAPDGGFVEALRRLALPENVEVAARAELGEEAGALGRVDGGVERGEEGVV